MKWTVIDNNSTSSSEFSLSTTFKDIRKNGFSNAVILVTEILDTKNYKYNAIIFENLSEIAIWELKKNLLNDLYQNI